MGIGSWVPGPLTFKYLRGFISHQSLIKQSYARTCLITTFFFALHYHSFTFLRQCLASKFLLPTRR